MNVTHQVLANTQPTNETSTLAARIQAAMARVQAGIEAGTAQLDD